VDEFLTDEQQADRARHWLRANGVFIAAGVVLGLGGLFGWQQWQDYQLGVAGKASIVWEQLRAAVEGERFNEVNETLALLEKDYKRTPYLDQARLLLAQMHMDRNAPDEALAQLKLLTEAGRDPMLRKVAALRTAQVLAYQGQFDEALTALGSSDDTPFAGLYHDLRGDILFAQGQLEDAAAEYELAIETDTVDSIDRAYVQIKLDDVRGPIAVTAVATPASPPAVSAEPSAASKD
jgi:predicted negative regulator of RcsB-dependent stress response